MDVPYWHSSAEERRNRDVYKTHEANKNGYSVIRIFQEDIWHDTYDWKNDILLSIKKCETSVQNVFCSSEKNKELYDKIKLHE